MNKQTASCCQQLHDTTLLCSKQYSDKCYKTIR